MLGFYQKTIKREIQFKGVGLHNGKKVNMKLVPAAPNHGIVFKRTDLKTKNLIPAILDNVSNAVLCTSIQNEFGVTASMIEHLMGALYGEEIDNLLIEIDSSEVPIMDGSAKEFIKQIRAAGTKNYDTSKKFIKVLKKCELAIDKKFILIEPYENDLKIDFEIIYRNQLINKQRKSVSLSNGDLDLVYNSRTFCLFEDIEKIKRLGLGKGGSLENAVVVEDNKVLNEGGLRYKNEFVMHKILDCMGDLMLANYKILGKVECSQGGHQLTNALLKKFLSNGKYFSVVEFKEKKLPNSTFYSSLVAASA
jgi:UDP-3-O-[3-hydroxymyristoyl] N-acetylglucosamine deacetylase|tara:strand:- start:2362 stop:3282 length:921 start_codon:yes stop_codon:yes gene_type:complete